MTAEEFTRAVDEAKAHTDLGELERHVGLEIACLHNVRRKLAMMRAVSELHRHLHGGGERPAVMPSAAFNSFEGSDKTNLHYLFKEMSSVPPWELSKGRLVKCVAVTELMLGAAAELFPSRELDSLRLLVTEFVNRWTLPKLRTAWSEDELARQVDAYRRDMKGFEDRFNAAYSALSVHFGAIERQAVSPAERRIGEIDARTKSIATDVKAVRTAIAAQARKLDLTLFEASGQNPAFEVQPSDVKSQMVEMARAEIARGTNRSVTAICNSIIRRFSGISGAYVNGESMRRRLNRTL